MGVLDGCVVQRSGIWKGALRRGCVWKGQKGRVLHEMICIFCAFVLSAGSILSIKIEDIKVAYTQIYAHKR